MDLSVTSETFSRDQYEDEELDPRVKGELDKLNLATDEINKLEAALEEANSTYRHELSESSSQLQALGKKIGSAVDKARPYFEASQYAKKLHLDCQRTAVQYHRANAIHQAARTTITLAEERFSNPSNPNQRQFDSAWQEMLNHATRKVLEAEAGRCASEREHLRRSAAFTAAQQKVATLARQLKSSISKAQPYFEQKELFDAQLEQMCQRVSQLQRSISSAKLSYAHALKNLEQISEEIHEQRRCLALVREPGVGAEELRNLPVEPAWHNDESMKVNDSRVRCSSSSSGVSSTDAPQFDKCTVEVISNGYDDAELLSHYRPHSKEEPKTLNNDEMQRAHCGQEATSDNNANTGRVKQADIAETNIYKVGELGITAQPVNETNGILKSVRSSENTISEALASTSRDIDELTERTFRMTACLRLDDDCLFASNPCGADRSISYVSNELRNAQTSGRSCRTARCDLSNISNVCSDIVHDNDDVINFNLTEKVYNCNNE